MRSWRRFGLGALVAGALVAATGCGGGEGDAGAGRGGPGPETVLAAFPPAPAPPGPAASPDDFVGAAACADCHAAQYAAWAGSTHGRAGGAPSPDVIVAPFDGTPIRFADGVVVPERRGGDYRFVVRQEGHPEQVFIVDGVVGGGHMIGGGTQGFVSRLADGTVRFLAFDWSVTAGLWFCNTGPAPTRGGNPSPRRWPWPTAATGRRCGRWG